MYNASMKDRNKYLGYVRESIKKYMKTKKNNKKMHWINNASFTRTQYSGKKQNCSQLNKIK